MNELNLRIDDDAVWAELPEAQKTRVLALQKIFLECAAAERPRKALAEKWPDGKMWFKSFKRFESAWYEARKRGWHALMDRRSAAFALGNGMPLAARDHWHVYCLKHKRKMKPAHTDMLANFRNGEVIPGVGSWKDAYAKERGGELPDVCPPFFVPRSLSYWSCTRHKPSKHDLALARIGQSAADDFRPLIATTRALPGGGPAILPGQIYMFDDIVHDHKVVDFGANDNRPYRPIELDCLDLGSGFLCGMFLLRCHTDIETEETVKNIREKHMRFFIAHVLMDCGYRKEGTILIDEHRTAHIPTDVAEYIGKFTDGAVTFNRSGIEGEPVLKGLFGEAPRGNFRFKAALESLRNLQHNRLDALPGQTGKDRNHAPQENYGREKKHGALMRALMKLSPHSQRALFELCRMGYCTFTEFSQIANEAYNEIGSDTEHDLEGWEACGYLMKEFVAIPGGRGEPIDEIFAMQKTDPESYEGVMALIRANPARYTRTRKLSRQEVWNRRTGMERLPWWHAPAILGKENAVEWTVTDHYELEKENHPVLGAGPHVYIAKLETPMKQRVMLRARETYLTYVSPLMPQWMIVCDAKGSVLGRCERKYITNRLDVAGMAKSQTQTGIVKMMLQKNVKAHVAAEAAQNIADGHYNEILIEAAKRAEAEAAKDAAAQDAECTEFVPASAPVAPPPAEPPAEKFNPAAEALRRKQLREQQRQIAAAT